MFNFVFDHWGSTQPYPNLAPEVDIKNGYSVLGNQYPFVVPVRLLYYSEDHHYPINIFHIDQDWPAGSYYPIGLGFFNYTVDYFELMSNRVKGLLKSNCLKVLFYYHEGDNPYLEKIRLDELCHLHNLPLDCYRFVSGNTQADLIENFVYFPDHELFYWRANKTQPAIKFNNHSRSKDFTLLSRTHKWWRASVVARLKQLGYLDNSYWSYNVIDIGDQYTDNPIELYTMPELIEYLPKFLKQGPYTCDELDSSLHNNHRHLVNYHFNNSYCHIVLETLYDADQSNGAFLTEKIFKPIKHAQPFIIFGTSNSLKTLQQLGYRTFDHAIDNRYDDEPNNSKRFFKTINAIEQLSKTDLHAWYLSCQDDIEYNQQLFLSNKWNRLNNLYKRLSK